ncbi:MAG TPA: sigma-70 family RNA polymerase sigma factor [Streptosporangiaceae bacterium]|nr:sigma-70 family RNA polymerase sigma factor [Streptosporangiaceae bacterium]
MTEIAPLVTDSPATDAELIAAARSGDAAAYGLLYERHSGAATRLARQIVDDQADVDDVVAETFARVLSALRRGIGPAEAFRPYLLTAVRRAAIDVLRGRRRQVPTENTDLPDPGEPFIDPVVAGLDRSLAARAFLSLPERWSAVLWHTEIEEAKPAEIAAMLGMSANSVAALSYRAREGLRQAYLQLHLSGRTDASCRPFAARLGAYVRGSLSRRHVREVDAHLRGCASCSAACADLTAINDALRGVLAPVVLGGAAAGYLADLTHAPTAGGATTGHTAAGHTAAGAAMIGRHVANASRLLRLAAHRPVIPITAAVAAATVTVSALYLVHPRPQLPGAGGHSDIVRSHQPGSEPVPGSSGHPRSVPGAAPSASPGPTIKGKSPAPGKPGQPGRPKPRTSRSVSPSPSPSPPASPSSPPTASASPSPTVSVGASVAATAKLSVGVQVKDLLNLGVTALVNISVSDTGTASTGPMTATLALPSGTTMLGLAGSSSWSCTTTGSGGTCTHAAIGAGTAANFSFNMLVISLAGCGSSVLATVAGGNATGSGSSPQQVQCSGGLLSDEIRGVTGGIPRAI